MNRELVEILIGIYQIDKSSKTILCSKVPRPLRGGEFNVYPFDCMKLCNSRCDVCPLGYIHFIYRDDLHYLEHLITLMNRGNI